MFDFWTSDLHLGHARINELSNRPFSSVDEMNETIIARWNSVVTAKDSVCLVGDICMGKIVDSLALIPRLNGTKFLIPGNHDRFHPAYSAGVTKQETWAQKYREVGFEILPVEILTEIGGVNVKVCHFPYQGDSHEEDRYQEFRPAKNGVLIHGHVHEKWKINSGMINVGVDVWDFTPVSTEVLSELIQHLDRPTNEEM